MPLEPRTVFENFAQHLGRFTAATDAAVEDQFFDRKEIPKPLNGNVSQNVIREIKEQIREIVSAFANTNPEGGLLIVGISKTGDRRGINHLTDTQRNELSNIGQLLRNQAAFVRLQECTDADGTPNRLLLVFVPHTSDAICQTPEAMPRAWKRVGAQNLALTERDREQLRRDKRIESSERRLASPYDPAAVDRALLAEIRKTWPGVANVFRSDEDLLHEFGAIERTPQGVMFTNAGLLFFTSNPQRVLPSAQIRILRYEANHNDPNRGNPTLDRTFSGSISSQLLNVREFLRESALIRVYHVRRPDGAGFEEKPELPFAAVDEAIVNAAAHREYGLEWATECVYYRDALVDGNQAPQPLNHPVRHASAPRRRRLRLPSLLKQYSRCAWAAARLHSRETRSGLAEGLGCSRERWPSRSSSSAVIRKRAIFATASPSSVRRNQHRECPRARPRAPRRTSTRRYRLPYCCVHAARQTFYFAPRFGTYALVSLA